MRKLTWIPLLALVAAGASTGCSASLSTNVRSDVKTTMETRHGAIARCYERALERDDATEGDLTLAFKVNEGSRKLRSVAVKKSTVKDTALENCVIAQTRRARLSKKPNGEVAVLYPVSFRQRE